MSKNPHPVFRFRSASFIVLLAILSGAGTAPGEAQDGERFGGDAWPRLIDGPAGRITVYEPQLETLAGNHLTARAAVSAVPAGASDALFGGVWLDADLKTDPGRQVATFLNVRIADIRFPRLDARDAAAWREEIGTDFQNWDLKFPLDRLLEDWRVLEARKAAAQQIKADVPRILFRTCPSVLLTIDGEPSWRELPGEGYRRLVNTPHFVVQETSTGICYLNLSPYWWAASGPAGPWQPLGEAPAEVVGLRKTEPAPQVPPASGAVPPRPEIVQVAPPAELIWTDGAPDYAPIRGTGLLYVRNTESDVLLDIESQLTYALLSGRWFRSADRVTWEFVPADKLPLDFSRVPSDSEKHHLLACVAGTPEARDAVRDATIPQTGAVATGGASSLWVSYDGEPRFTDVPESSVRYAANSPYAVFDVNTRYYCCDDGVWYDSESPYGPWLVSLWVPPALYLLPPSCPYYYVTHCRIYGYSPWAVYCGYDSGYLGCYAWHGTPVYGTGWRYSCWSGHVWVPRPATWGCGVHFNARGTTWTVHAGSPATGAWTGLHRPHSGRGTSVSVGVGGAPVLGASHGRTIGGASSAPNFYARHPERVASLRPLPAERVVAGASAGPVPAAAERRPERQDRRDAAEVPMPPPAPAAHRLPTVAQEPPPAAHEPPPVAHEHPRVPPPTAPRGIPERAPSPEAHESGGNPKAPPTVPPARENHEPPRRLPPVPVPSPGEHRDPPRTPPKPVPPSPVEHREPPRTPPPAPPPPPPREHRDPPPPPLSQNDRRDSSQDRAPGRR